MKRKMETVRDEVISQIGGVAVGATIGSIVGPEGAAVGAAVGSVGALLAAKTAPEYFQNTILRGYFSNRKILKLLREKIDADFGYSFLTSQGTFDQAMDSARRMLHAANSTDESIDRLESRLPRGFRWNLSATDGDAEIFAQRITRLGEYCRAHGPIRIGSAATCPATIGIFRDLHSRFAQTAGLQIHTPCDEINGRDFFQSLQTACDLDFAIGPLEALVLADPERKLPLRILGPMFGVRQRIFVSTKKHRGFRHGIWVFSRSSAKLQYQVGLAIPRSADEQEIPDARQIPDLVENIPPADMVIAWDPLSSVFSKRPDFAVVHHSEYTVHFMLFAHRRLIAPRRFPLQDFLGVVLTEWRRFQRNHDSLVDGLRRDHRYMKAFASGSGHQWMHEM